jgi:hypothetical protein
MDPRSSSSGSSLELELATGTALLTGNWNWLLELLYSPSPPTNAILYAIQCCRSKESRMASESHGGLFNRSSIAVFAEAYEGLGDVHGILSFDGRSLKLSFQTADALFGLLKSRTTELIMPLEAIEQLDFKLGWFWLMPYVELRLRGR